MSFCRLAGHSIRNDSIFSPNRPSLDWVNEKYQVLGRHVVGDLNKIRGKLNVIGNEHDVMRNELDAVRNELGIRGNENRLLRERVENLEQTLNLDHANLLKLPRTQEVGERQHKISQFKGLHKTLAQPRSHHVILRNHYQR